LFLETLKKRNISVIIDTGFSGEFCLLKSNSQHRFERFRREPFVLADGRIVRADVTRLRFTGQTGRSVEVISLDNPDFGTQLLQRAG
jgi:predicted aspartyl protease